MWRAGATVVLTICSGKYVTSAASIGSHSYCAELNNILHVCGLLNYPGILCFHIHISIHFRMPGLSFPLSPHFLQFGSRQCNFRALFLFP